MLVWAFTKMAVDRRTRGCRADATATLKHNVNANHMQQSNQEPRVDMKARAMVTFAHKHLLPVKTRSSATARRDERARTAAAMECALD